MRRKGETGGRASGACELVLHALARAHGHRPIYGDGNAKSAYHDSQGPHVRVYGRNRFIAAAAAPRQEPVQAGGTSVPIQNANFSRSAHHRSLCFSLGDEEKMG